VKVVDGLVQLIDHIVHDIFVEELLSLSFSDSLKQRSLVECKEFD
jgi:hypothetical protein